MDDGLSRVSGATPGYAGDALAALRELRQTRAALAELERTLVVAARNAHASWREIGAALGVTGQATHRRFRALDPLPRRERDPLLAELDALHGSFEGRERRNTG